MSTQIIAFAKETKSKKLLFQELPYHAVNIIFYNHGQVLKSLGSLYMYHPRRPRGGQLGREKRRDESFQVWAEKPRVLTFTGPFPNGQANAGSWLGTKNALYYCAQSANSISWVLFVSSYTKATDSITAYLAHAPKKCTQSGNFQLDINCPFQNTVYPKPKDAFPKIQSWAYNRYLRFHRSRLRKY